MDRLKTFFIILRTPIIVVLSLIVITTVSLILINNNSYYNKCIRTADSEMAKQNFVSAKLQYQHAIEDNGKKKDAYYKLAKCIIEENRFNFNATENTFLKADDNCAELVFNALNPYSSPSSKKALTFTYIECAKELYESGDSINASKMLDKGYISTYSPQISKLNSEYLTKAKADFTELLKTTFLSKDKDAIRNIMLSGNFGYLVSYAANAPLIMQTGIENEIIGIYKDGSVYLGQSVNEDRSGTGTLYLESDIMSYTYSGEWKNDKPNGVGQINYAMYEENKPPLHLASCQMNGNFRDGQFDGAFTQLNVLNNSKKYTFHYTVSMGFPKELYQAESLSVIAKSIEDASQTISMPINDKLSVAGF